MLAGLAEKIEAPKLDSVFGNRAARQEKAGGGVVEIRLDETSNFKDHPYRVLDDDAMQDMADSIKEHGVLTPVLVRPKPDGGYEVVSGHRRKRGCELAGLETIPVIIREMDDDTAVIAMVDANLQREDILPSEKAKAYKMKMEALERKRGRPSKENSRQLVGNLETADIIGKDSGESGRQVQRYIRLNDLNPDLLEKVDTKEMAFTPAVELSFLKPEEQEQLADLLECEERTPSLSQAQRLKQLSQSGNLDEDTMLSVIVEQKPQQKVQIILKEDRISRYFPKSYTPKQMEDTIIKLLEGWYKKRQQEKER